METGTAHILTKLDRLHDMMRDQSENLSALRGLVQEWSQSKGESPKERRISSAFLGRIFNGWSPFWQSIAVGAILWVIGVCIKSYLSRGGDPMALIDLAVKLLP